MARDSQWVVAVDLDDTILSKNYPGGRFAKFHYGDPLPGAREAIQALRENYRVVIFTARDLDEEDAIRQHLENVGIEVDDVICGKPRFLVLIDDRAIQFSGWEQALQEAQDKLAEGEKKRGDRECKE